MNTNEVLIAAKNLILEKGWIQKDYKNKHGYCVMGACSYAVPNSKDREVFYEALDVINDLIPNSSPREDGLKLWGDIQRWNDEKGRTKEEIINLLDQAIVSTLPSEGA